MWGSNVPLTRTPDAHWMAEARYRGQKVIAVAPDYAENVKFADEWLAPHPGTDAALAMAMGHTILKEFYVENSHELFENYSRHYTDLPFLVELAVGEDGEYHPGKFVVAADLAIEESDTEHAEFKPVMFDRATGAVVVPPGTLGHRFSDDGAGKWTLGLGEIDPALSMMAHREDVAEVLLPRFDTAGQGGRGDVRRGVPIRRIGDRVVTTVFDLLLAEYGVGRAGLPGQWAGGLDDAEALYTPAWQEEITGVPGPAAARIAREFAQSALDSGGRSMIIMGAGTNHWFHSDTIYRTFLTLTNLCATQGVNGGGWALRRAGEGAPDHRVDAPGERTGLGPPAAADDPDQLLVHVDRPVALRPGRDVHPDRDHRGGQVRRRRLRRRRLALGAAPVAAVLPPVRRLLAGDLPPSRRCWPGDDSVSGGCAQQRGDQL